MLKEVSSEYCERAFKVTSPRANRGLDSSSRAGRFVICVTCVALVVIVVEFPAPITPYFPQVLNSSSLLRDGLSTRLLVELLCKPENEETVGGKGEEAGENGEGDVEDENDSLLGKPNIDQGDDEFKELFSSER